MALFQNTQAAKKGREGERGGKEAAGMRLVRKDRKPLQWNKD